MADEAMVMDAGVDTGVDESSSLETLGENPEGQESAVDKTTDKNTQEKDGRKVSDPLRRRIADLKRQADTMTDPEQKKALLNDARALSDTLGRSRAYEELIPTVAEAREIKALLDAVGGREGVAKLQEAIGDVDETDRLLEAGDASVLDRIWPENPQAIAKLVPAILERIGQENPTAYFDAITPHALNFIEQSGFSAALQEIYTGLEQGDSKAILQTIQRMAQWLAGQKAQSQQKYSKQTRVDPERQKFETEKQQFENQKQTEAVNSAYNSVVDHAGPSIDKVLKPMVAKLGLSAEQYSLLREDTWKYIQDTRNSNATYKITAASKMKQGMTQAADYIKKWTDDNARTASEHVVKLRYGHQLKAGTAAKSPTGSPTGGKVNATVNGKEPLPSEIDYSSKGLLVAKRAGFKDIGDMILSGQAPLKTGVTRKWR